MNGVVGLLGVKPSRHFRIYKEAFPAIFRFDGRLYMEEVNIDTNKIRWAEISEETAMRYLEVLRNE